MMTGTAGWTFRTVGPAGVPALVDLVESAQSVLQAAGLRFAPDGPILGQLRQPSDADELDPDRATLSTRDGRCARGGHGPSGTRWQWLRLADRVLERDLHRRLLPAVDGIARYCPLALAVWGSGVRVP